MNGEFLLYTPAARDECGLTEEHTRYPVEEYTVNPNVARKGKTGPSLTANS